MKLQTLDRRTVATWILIAVNVLLAVLGIVVFSVVIFLETRHSVEFELLGNKALLSTIVGLGVLMVLLAVVGQLGIYFNSNKLIVAYQILIILIGLIVIGIGATVLIFEDDLENVEKGKVENSYETKIVHFQLAVFSKCCSEFLVPCSNVNEICVSDEELFQDFESSISIDDCSFFAGFNVDGHPLVGSADEQGCGLNNSVFFSNDMSDFMIKSFKRAGRSAVVIGVISVFLLFCSCFVYAKENKTKASDERKPSV